MDNARKADFIRTCIAEEGVEVPDCIQLGKDLKHFKGIVSRIKAEEATLAYLTEQESTGEDYVNIEMSNKRLRDLQLDKDDTKVNQLATQIKIISALSVEQEQVRSCKERSDELGMRRFRVFFYVTIKYRDFF